MSRIEFDRDSGHADVAGHPRVIRIVAAMRREIEGDREAALACREIAAVEGVRVLRRREARILPDRPGLGDIHGGVWPTEIRREPRPAVDEVDAGDVALLVGGLEGDALRGDEGFTAQAAVARVRCPPGKLAEVGKIGRRRFRRRGPGRAGSHCRSARHQPVQRKDGATQRPAPRVVLIAPDPMTVKRPLPRRSVTVPAVETPIAVGDTIRPR